jgi:arylsulfatase A-like enzyme
LQHEPFSPPNLNEADVSDKPQWVKNKALLTVDELQEQKELRLKMRRCLLSVDDMVEDVINTLTMRGIIDNTIFIFVSDNGYMWGEHRCTGKSVPYREATRMPMVVRAPMLMNNPNTGALISIVDIAPTLLRAVGGDESGMDGHFLQNVFQGLPGPSSLYCEHQEQGNTPAWANVIKQSWTYTWYGNAGEELYDIVADPYQLNNVVSSKPTTRATMKQECHDLMAGSPPPGMVALP